MLPLGSDYILLLLIKRYILIITIACSLYGSYSIHKKFSVVAYVCNLYTLSPKVVPSATPKVVPSTTPKVVPKAQPLVCM